MQVVTGLALTSQIIYQYHIKQQTKHNTTKKNLWQVLHDLNKLDKNYNNLCFTLICCRHIRQIEDIWLFQCKIDFYFTEWTPKVIFSRVAEPRVKILLLVFMSEIKIYLTLKKPNFLFLLCFKIAIIKFIQCVSNQDRETASFLVVLHQIWCFQRVYWVWYWLQL